MIMCYISVVLTCLLLFSGDSLFLYECSANFRSLLAHFDGISSYCQKSQILAENCDFVVNFNQYRIVLGDTKKTFLGKGYMQERYFAFFISDLKKKYHVSLG